MTFSTTTTINICVHGLRSIVKNQFFNLCIICLSFFFDYFHYASCSLDSYVEFWYTKQGDQSHYKLKDGPEESSSKITLSKVIGSQTQACLLSCGIFLSSVGKPQLVQKKMSSICKPKGHTVWTLLLSLISKVNEKMQLLYSLCFQSYNTSNSKHFLYCL